MKKCFYVDVNGDELKIGVLTEAGEKLRGSTESLESWTDASEGEVKSLFEALQKLVEKVG